MTKPTDDRLRKIAEALGWRQVVDPEIDMVAWAYATWRSRKPLRDEPPSILTDATLQRDAIVWLSTTSGTAVQVHIRPNGEARLSYDGYIVGWCSSIGCALYDAMCEELGI